MVGPIFNLFFLKCSFGRPFVGLDDRLFVWTIVRSFERSFVRLDVRLFVWTIVCWFGRSFVGLDDRLFVWTIVCSFGRSFFIWTIVCSFGRSLVGRLGDVLKQCDTFLSLWRCFETMRHISITLAMF